jgi:hypothetical protein
MPVLACVFAQSTGGDLNRASSSCRFAILRGRETVRADRRLHTDEKHIRAQSTIWDKTPTPLLLLSITAFSVRMVFIRTENAVGAHSAQVFCWHATVHKKSNLVACVGKHEATHG